MKPQIYIKNFAQFEDIKLDINSFSIFSGQNGTGKTLLIKLYNTIKDSLFAGNQSFTSENMFKGIDYELNKDYNKEETLDLFKLYINYYLDPDRLIKNTFGHNNINLDRVEIQNINFPEMMVNTKFHSSSADSLINATLKFPNNEFDDINEVIHTKSDQESDFLKIIILQNLLPQIIKKALIQIVNHPMNIKISNRNVLYFPASREAYIRDYNQLIKTGIMRHRDLIQEKMQSTLEGKSEQETSNLIQGFLNSGFFKEGNLFSEDPYIERFCETLTKLPNMSPLKNKTNIDLEYFKNNILKSSFTFNEDIATYELQGDISYSALNASSLENEYSIFYESLRKLNNNSYIIEEPEAHLSMINSMKLTLYLFSLYTKGYNFTLSTHSTVVIDSINYCYILSKIEEKSRQVLIENNELPHNLVSINEDLFDDISVYVIKNSTIEKIPLTDYGYMLDDFNEQIGQVNDLLYEIEQIYDEKNEK